LLLIPIVYFSQKPSFKCFEIILGSIKIVFTKGLIIKYFECQNIEIEGSIYPVTVKFRQFKSNKRTTYIFRARKGEYPCTKYACIDEEAW